MSLPWRATIGAVVIVVTSPLVAALPAVANASDNTASPLPEGRAVANTAHRGASIGAPENTLAAVRQAIAQHANFVGIDVQWTRDHQLVVLHDTSLDRTTNVEQVFPERAPWLIEEFTLAEIQRLDAGSWKSPAYTDERVPTLGEVLDELSPSSTGAFLEIKHPALYGGADGIGDHVVDEVRLRTTWLTDGGPKDRLVVQAFNDVFLREFEARHDEVVVGTLGSVGDPNDYAAWADQINVPHREITADLVDDAHAAGLAVSTYVVNDDASMDNVIAAGTDAISTNYPDRLHDVLAGESRVMTDPNAPPPPAEPTASVLSVTAPGTALLQTRIPLTVRLRGVDGTPARWTWVQVQVWDDGRWRTLQRRVTNRFGDLRTTVRIGHQLSVRAVSAETPWHAAAKPVVREIQTRKAGTRVRLYGDRRVADGGSARLQVRWTAEDGRRITGSAKLWARPQGQRWRVIREVTVRDGYRQVRVAPKVDTRYEIRARQGPWWTADRDRHYIDHVR